METKTKKGQPFQEKRWQSFSKVASNSVNPEFQSYLDSYLIIAKKIHKISLIDGKNMLPIEKLESLLINIKLVS